MKEELKTLLVKLFTFLTYVACSPQGEQAAAYTVAAILMMAGPRVGNILEVRFSKLFFEFTTWPSGYEGLAVRFPAKLLRKRELVDMVAFAESQKGRLTWPDPTFSVGKATVQPFLNEVPQILMEFQRVLKYSPKLRVEYLLDSRENLSIEELFNN